MIRFSAISGAAIATLTEREALATSRPWTAKNLHDSVKASADCHLIETDTLEIGYCVVQCVLDEAELLNIVIFKPFQAQGYGRKVMAKLKQALADKGITKLFLDVRLSNTAAKALYDKIGFEVLHVRRNYYSVQNGAAEDALVMRCVL